VTADKLASGFGNDWFKFLHDDGFDTADICYQGTGFERANHSLRQFAHLTQWSAKDNQIGILHSGSEVGECAINDSEFFALANTGRAAHIADDVLASRRSLRANPREPPRSLHQ